MDRPRVNRRLLTGLYDRLFRAFGPQHWWPGRTLTEIVVGAILTQNTAWTNVQRAIANLEKRDCLRWDKLRDLPAPRLAASIKPAGTYRVKAKRLKAFVDTLWRDHAGSLDAMLSGDLDVARQRLLAIPGIGPETADAILLYAGSRPSFVIDAYTLRVLRRHFILDARTGYEAARSLFHEHLAPDAKVFNEFHALFVAVGKKHCRPAARCDGCPLEDLPHDERLV